MDDPTIPPEPSAKRVKVSSNNETLSENDSASSSGCESETSGEAQRRHDDVPSEKQEVTVVNHQDNSSNRPKTPSSKDDENDEVHEKMVMFLTGKPSSERSRYAKAFKFPTKLFYVLECGDFNDVISWTSDGNSFTVHDSEAFTAKVPPSVLREAKFSSFHRKLNRWNFVKVPGESRTYTHPRFKRGELELCKTINCSGQIVNQHHWPPFNAAASGTGNNRPINEFPSSVAAMASASNPLITMQGAGRLPDDPNMALRDLHYQIYGQHQHGGIDPTLALAAEQRLAYYAQLGSSSFRPPTGGNSTGNNIVAAPSPNTMHRITMENPMTFHAPSTMSSSAAALDNTGRLLHSRQMDNRPVNMMPSSIPYMNDAYTNRGSYFMPSASAEQIQLAGNPMLGYSPYNPSTMQMTSTNLMTLDALRHHQQQQQQQGGQLPPVLMGQHPLNQQAATAAALNRYQIMEMQSRNQSNVPMNQKPNP